MFLCGRRRNALLYNLGAFGHPATPRLPPRAARLRPHTSILSVDKFRHCLCLVFRPLEIFAFVIFLYFVLILSVHFVWQQKTEWSERSGYNLFYSRLGRNSAVDGCTPIYPHLGVINVNALASVGACESRARPPALTCMPTPADSGTDLPGIHKREKL